jgi:hypothetical protein
MRNLTKGVCPPVLAENAAAWTAAYAADLDGSTARYRYRHREVKGAIRDEAFDKCVYCESRVGHNTPGDVEHKVPSSHDMQLHFRWENLALACTECNRRKGSYYDPVTPFLDPFVDDVEAMLLHHGPIVGWRPGEVRAEVTVRRLELNDLSRPVLMGQKVEKIEELNHIIGRLRGTSAPALQAALEARLDQMRDVSAEYSGMVVAIASAVGF